MGLTPKHPGSSQVVINTFFNPVGGQTDPNSGNNNVTQTETILGLSSSASDFGDQSFGTIGPARTITVTNLSAQTVTFGTAAKAGANIFDFFSFDDSCSGKTVVSGGTCNLVQRFAPGDLGARSETLTLSPNAGSVDPLAVLLTGNGVPLPTSTGPAGPTGPQGPAGPSGPPGQTVVKLAVAPALAKLSSRTGRSVAFRYASTLAANVVLDVLKGTKRLARVRGKAKAGANSLKWNGRLGRKPAAPGGYRLRLTATNGVQKALAVAALRVGR